MVRVRLVNGDTVDIFSDPATKGIQIPLKEIPELILKLQLFWQKQQESEVWSRPNQA